MSVGRSGIPDIFHRRSPLSAQRSGSGTSSPHISKRDSSHLAVQAIQWDRDRICSHVCFFEVLVHHYFIAHRPHQLMAAIFFSEKIAHSLIPKLEGH